MADRPTPTHIIRTVEDFLTVPPDDIEACMHDFANWLRLHHAVRQLFPDGPLTAAADEFRWINDGRDDMYPEVHIVGDEEPRDG